MKHYKPREILEKGNIIDHWACDVGDNGMESNAGKEHLIEFNNEYFTIITSIYSGNILGWHKLDKENELKEGDFVADLIKQIKNKGV